MITDPSLFPTTRVNVSDPKPAVALASAAPTSIEASGPGGIVTVVYVVVVIILVVS